jgi:hypothetical protein
MVDEKHYPATEVGEPDIHGGARGVLERQGSTALKSTRHSTNLNDHGLTAH